MVAQLTAVEKNQEILSLALEVSQSFQDLVSNSNVLLAQLKMKGNWKEFSGPIIRERLLYNKTGNALWYQGYDMMNNAPAELFNDAEWRPKMVAIGISLSNEEILFWQGRFRRVFVALVGLGTTLLKWQGVIASNSVVAQRIGTRQALLWCLVMVSVYLVLNEAVMLWVRRGGVAGHGAIGAAIVADMALLFGVAYFATPPAEYARALIVSIFTVQFTLLFVGARATLF